MLTEDKPADDVSRPLAEAQCQGTGRTIDTMEVIMDGAVSQQTSLEDRITRSWHFASASPRVHNRSL